MRSYCYMVFALLCCSLLHGLLKDHKKALCPYLDVFGGNFRGSQKMALARQKRLRLAGSHSSIPQFSRIMCTIGDQYIGRYIGRLSTDYRSIVDRYIGRQSTDKCVDRYSLKPSILYRYMTDTWPILDRHLTDTWPTLDRYLTDTWPILDRYTTYTWPTPDRYLTDTRPIHNRYMTDTWPIHDRYFTDTSPILDWHLTDTWPTLHRCFTDTWPIIHCPPRGGGVYSTIKDIKL